MSPDLVRRAQAGDHDAFAALAAVAISRLHRTARLGLQVIRPNGAGRR